MKKQAKKLGLNRETLRRLDTERDLRNVQGGVPPETDDCSDYCDSVNMCLA